MKEQLITFDTAKLAKEKVFDLGVNQSYIIYKESYKYDDDPNHRESYNVGDIEINTHYHVNNCKGIDLSNELYEAYSAPTQSLLQKWLREVHAIHIQIQVLGQFVNGKNKFYSQVIEFGENKWISKLISEKTKFTYEEALEIGLQESLKLIKLKK